MLSQRKKGWEASILQDRARSLHLIPRGTAQGTHVPQSRHREMTDDGLFFLPRSKKSGLPGRVVRKNCRLGPVTHARSPRW